MVKKESTTCENCNCGSCCGGKCLGLILTALGCIAAIVACFYACKAAKTAQNVYNLNVLSAGGIENFTKMNELYSSEAYVKYATEQTDGYVTSFMSAYGDTDEDTTQGSEDTEDAAATNSNYSSLDSLKSIAIDLGTDSTSLQACIDEGRYTQAVNDMMNQANEVFGVNGTPGNVIVDTENGNYILVSGAYPVEEFVNAINEYKNGAENYVAGGDEVKAIVEDMLKSTPIRGKKDARFTIIEYTELLCPFCQRHSQAGTINAVIEQFPEEVNSVSRHFIIHGEEALQLASAMECVAELNPDSYHEVFEEAFAKGL